jgi:signal transduction histidine kinase
MTRSARATPALVLGGSLLLSLVITIFVNAAVDERVRKRFDLSVDDTVDRIERRLQSVEGVLLSSRALFVADGDVSRDEFARFAGGVGLGQDLTGVLGLGYAASVTPERREELVLRAHTEGMLDFHAWPPGDRTPQSMVLYFEHLDRSGKGALRDDRQLLGFDMLSEPTRRTAMLRARDSGLPALSGKVFLGVDQVSAPTGDVPGFVMFVPVYAGVAEPTSVGERRALLRGYIFAPFHADAMFTSLAPAAPTVTYRVYDADAADPITLVHDSALKLRAAGGRTGGELATDRRIEQAGRRWRLYFTSRPGFVSGFERSLPGLLGLMGVMVSFVLYRLTRAEARARDLAEMRQREAERVSRELDQFAYAASHDLKAPLRGIASLAAWLEEDLGDAMSETARKQLSLMQGRVIRLESLIEGMLRYAHAGRLGTTLENVDVASLLIDVVGLLAPPPAAKIKIEPGMPMIVTERAPLTQVFMNLIGNALKYADKDDPHVEVRFADDGNFWRFSVRDDGPGIDPQFHERVWGIFQTLHPRDRVESTGIGLSVVRKIVEARGGRAWIESKPGRGATFRFTWPKSEAATEARATG